MYCRVSVTWECHKRGNDDATQKRRCWMHRLRTRSDRDVTVSCARSLEFLTRPFRTERDRTRKARTKTRLCQIQTLARCTCARALFLPQSRVCLAFFLLCLTRVVRTPFSQFARLVRSSSSISSKSTRTAATAVSSFHPNETCWSLHTVH